MYTLTIEEIVEYIDLIIRTLEESDEATFGIVIELAYQLKDELSAALDD